jgi:hypothetical protein
VLSVVNSASNITTEIINGRPHIVVRGVTPIVDDIVMNGKLYTAAEIAKGYKTLERTPMPLGHPKVDGKHVSARDVQAVNEYHVGAWLQDVEHKGGKVSGDMYVDRRYAESTEKGQRLVNRLDEMAARKNVEPIHISTGLLYSGIAANGESKGKKYREIVTNMMFDHVANLLDEPVSYFDYTFDDEDVSLGQRMETICDAAGVSVYWDDSVLSFTLDMKRTVPATVFNRSNTVDVGYSLSYDMTFPGGYDGVEVQYRNPTTNKQAYIRYRVRNNQIEAGRPLKAKKFEMMYVRDGFQADYRAQKECRRLLYSRMSMAITALADGEWVNVGDMVQVPDTYDTNQQAGYIVSRSGNSFETSERINFTGTMYVVITDSIGNSSARYPASPYPETAFGFTAAIPQMAPNIFDGYDVQSPSRYVIATTEELNATQWVISEKQPNSDGTTALTLAEYSALIYP